MLKQENRYDFRKRMVSPHVPGKRDYSLLPDTDEFVLENGLYFVCAQDFSKVVTHAIEDFSKFLSVSMGVEVCQQHSAAAQAITLQLSDDLGDYNTYKGYRIAVGETVTISGYDERGLAQALYNLEDVLSLRRAPYLKKGVFCRKPMYSPMMVHSGYGFDAFPNEYLQQVARSGRDAILIFVKDINQTPAGELDFNDVIARAASYGLDVYAYSKLVSNHHPDDPEAEAAYESTYGQLFEKCPGFKGVTLVGESVEFPSKDPHTSGTKYYNNEVDGIPTGKPSPGWFPCCDYPQWLRLLQKVIYRHKPDADIVLWSYNWGKQPEADRVRLIENLPEGITLLVTFEMGEPFMVGEYSDYCADYTLSFAGPGGYFTSEAKAAKKRNIRLYSMTNTGGTSWDFGIVPYEPMPQQWQKRYKEMEKAHDLWNLSGIMECHHFGMYPSFISKLSKWTFTEPRIPYDQLLDKVLEEEFGPNHVATIREALALWSEAITHYIPSDADQYGAFRVGMAYPFCLDTEIVMQSSPNAVFKGKSICYTNYIDFEKGHGAAFVGLRVPEEIKSLEIMKELFGAGLKLLDEIPDKNTSLEYLVNQGHFMYHNIISGIHAKQWYCLKCDAKASRTRETLLANIEKMELLLQEEIQNSQQAIPYAQLDSRLGWEPSMDYLGDEWHIRWKIRHAEYVLNTELARWKKAANC